MRLLHIFLFAFATASRLLAEEPPDFAQVTFSNGDKTEGEFSLTPGKKLELFDVDKKKRFMIAPEEIVRLAATVEEEKMEQGWMFREEGLKDKIKLPFFYPLRQLLTEITLDSGVTLRGHVNSLFYLEKDGDAKRHLIYTNQKGEKGQALADLLYVKEIAFPNRKAAAGKLGTIAAPPKTTLLNVGREITIEAPFNALVPGKYDAFIFDSKFKQPFGATPYKIRFGLSGEKAPDEDVAGIYKKIELVEEFYTKKKIVAAIKDKDKVRALMELTRSEASYDAGLRFARWEVWTFEPTSSTWNIVKRLYLHREKFSDKEALPVFEYGSEDALKSVKESGEIK